jgi:diadenylate cyclase
MNLSLWFSLQNFNLMSIISVMLIVFLAILLYRYFKGSVAFYILFGLLFVYGISFALNKIGFYFLSNIIKQVTNYGLIFIAIIFQPELRSVLLTIGNNRIAKQIRKLKNKAFDSEITEKNKAIIAQIVEALGFLQLNNLGGTIVVFEGGDISTILNTGIKLNASVSSKLIESIFVKESPLHDGAVVIQDGLVKAASCILPVSEKLDLNSRVGLRHKSAVGVTEMANSLAIVVSETTGKISYAREGRLYLDRNIATIAQQLGTILNF